MRGRVKIISLFTLVLLGGAFAKETKQERSASNQDDGIYLEDEGSGDNRNWQQPEHRHHDDEDSSGSGGGMITDDEDGMELSINTWEDPPRPDTVHRVHSEPDFGVFSDASGCGPDAEHCDDADIKVSRKNDEEPAFEVPIHSDGDDIDIEEDSLPESRPEDTHTPESPPSDSNGASDIMGHKEKVDHASFFRQPGILAAVIGGAIVGLLCAILLVMFIVYRMRKKDEGSYPLEEQKRAPTNYSYGKNSREFYA